LIYKELVVTNRRFWFLLALVLVLFSFLIVSCGDDDDDDDDANDDDTSDDDDDSVEDDDDDTSVDDDDDDDNLPYPDVPRFNPIWPEANESVLTGSMTSCAIYRETTCINDFKHSCDIWDAGEGDFAQDPNPMLEQMYWYDRYYDLYLNMEGQHSDRYTTIPIAPGTPEEVWSDPAIFERYNGYGDASGWTGMVLGSAAARYQVTGTEADYLRMLDQFGSMMFLYEVTEIPGFLARSHFAMLQDDGIYAVGHPGKAIGHYSDPASGHFTYPLTQDILDRLPSYYTDGVEIQGIQRDVWPVWQGDASRDMHVRSLPGIMLAYDMLGDDAEAGRLRGLVEEAVPCTLNRMKKMRISNLQSNRLLREFVTKYLSGGRLILDPDDIDLTEIDTIIGYVMEQPNPAYMDSFDASCPAGPPLEITDPTYDLDAAKPAEFILKFLALSQRIGAGAELPIGWVLAPGVRGGDIAFMVQWALAAHYITGDLQYLQFVDQMMSEMEFWPLINTMGSFYNPKWCRPTFGPSLLYPTLWNMQARIDPTDFPDFWNQMGTAIYEEIQNKETAGLGDAFFGVLYDYMVDSDIDPDLDAFVDEMVDVLAGTEQYQAGPENKFDPRRNYPVLLHSDPPPDFNLAVEWPTQQDIDMCTEEVSLFGIVLFEGWIEDELPRAVDYLPMKWRVPGSMQFAMGPWMLERSYGGKAGRVTWPMQGLTSAYWTGRAQKTITVGDGTALAWRDTGESCE
jgi:hypothetical protein